VFPTQFNACVAMITAFWDVRLCRMVDIYQHFVYCAASVIRASETLVPTYFTT
jgi:hypothetical protein